MEVLLRIGGYGADGCSQEQEQTGTKQGQVDQADGTPAVMILPSTHPKTDPMMDPMHDGTKRHEPFLLAR